MTKTKNYRNGKFGARCYMKTAGNGWEVGFVYGGKPIFVGNFIHASEANSWWGTMNREIRNFSKRHKVTKNFPKNNYGKFLGAYLYSCYYRFLNTAFTKYTRFYGRTYNQGTRTFKTWNNRTNTTTHGPRVAYLRAA